MPPRGRLKRVSSRPNSEINATKGTKVFPAWGAFADFVLLINAFTYLVYWADKRRALNGAYRISENSLLLLALLGDVARIDERVAASPTRSEFM